MVHWLICSFFEFKQFKNSPHLLPGTLYFVIYDKVVTAVKSVKVITMEERQKIIQQLSVIVAQRQFYYRKKGKKYFAN